MFTNLREATREDWDRIDALDEARTDYAAAPLALFESLRGGDAAGLHAEPVRPQPAGGDPRPAGRRVGRDDRLHACSTMPPTGSAPANHGQIAAELLRPFVSDDHYWMVRMHGLFQKENFTNHAYWGSGVMDALLEPHRDHPAFELTRRFCRDYDAPSFDPGYDALPVEAFMPQVREVFERPYSFQA